MITNEQCMKNIRDNLLVEYEKSNKKSLAGFACQCEVSESELRSLICRRKDKKSVSLRVLIDITNALGKPVSWLIGEGKEDNKE